MFKIWDLVTSQDMFCYWPNVAFYPFSSQPAKLYCGTVPLCHLRLLFLTFLWIQKSLPQRVQTASVLVMTWSWPDYVRNIRHSEMNALQILVTPFSVPPSLAVSVQTLRKTDTKLIVDTAAGLTPQWPDFGKGPVRVGFVVYTVSFVPLIIPSRLCP